MEQYQPLIYRPEHIVFIHHQHHPCFTIIVCKVSGFFSVSFFLRTRPSLLNNSVILIWKMLLRGDEWMNKKTLLLVLTEQLYNLLNLISHINIQMVPSILCNNISIQFPYCKINGTILNLQCINQYSFYIYFDLSCLSLIRS